MEYLIIAIEPAAVIAARFTFSGRTAVVEGSARFPLKDGGSLADAARSIAAGSVASLRIILCLPPQLFAQRQVALPLSELRKVREVLPAHFQGETALPAEDAVFDAIPTGEGSYLALWAKREEVRAAIALFREAGCEPQVVSSVPFGWSFLPGVPPDGMISDGSALVLLKEGRLSFFRALDSPGTGGGISATVSALEFSGVTVPDRLFLCGEGGAALDRDSLPVPVELLELPDEQVRTFRTDDTFRALAGLYAVACACHAGGLPDFRRGDLACTVGNAAAKKKLRRTALLATAVIVLLFVWKGMQYRAARVDLASLNRSIGTIYREIFPGRTKAVDEVAEVKGEIRKLAGADSGTAVLDTLRRIAEAKGGTVNGLFDAEFEGSAVRLKGDARSAQAVNDFKRALTGVLVFSESGEVKSRPDGTVSFVLAGTVREGTR